MSGRGVRRSADKKKKTRHCSGPSQRSHNRSLRINPGEGSLLADVHLCERQSVCVLSRCPVRPSILPPLDVFRRLALSACRRPRRWRTRLYSDTSGVLVAGPASKALAQARAVPVQARGHIIPMGGLAGAAPATKDFYRPEAFEGEHLQWAGWESSDQFHTRGPPPPPSPIPGAWGRPPAITWLGAEAHDGRTHQNLVHCCGGGCPGESPTAVYGPCRALPTFLHLIAWHPPCCCLSPRYQRARRSS